MSACAYVGAYVGTHLLDTFPRRYFSTKVTWPVPSAVLESLASPLCEVILVFRKCMTMPHNCFRRHFVVVAVIKKGWGEASDKSKKGWGEASDKRKLNEEGEVGGGAVG